MCYTEVTDYRPCGCIHMGPTLHCALFQANAPCGHVMRALHRYTSCARHLSAPTQVEAEPAGVASRETAASEVASSEAETEREGEEAPGHEEAEEEEVASSEAETEREGEEAPRQEEAEEEEAAFSEVETEREGEEAPRQEEAEEEEVASSEAETEVASENQAGKEDAKAEEVSEEKSAEDARRRHIIAQIIEDAERTRAAFLADEQGHGMNEASDCEAMKDRRK